jgi:hypothetical protein
MLSTPSKVDLTRSVSQFTLHASLKKGNKPDFHQSASGDKARTYYQTFFDRVCELYSPDKVKNGVFAAMMDVALVNDGPVSVGPYRDNLILASSILSANNTLRSRFRLIRIQPKLKVNQVHNHRHKYQNQLAVIVKSVTALQIYPTMPGYTS